MTMAPNYRKSAENMLRESKELSLRPRKGDRVEVLIHAFDFLFREYARETPTGAYIVDSKDVSQLIRGLRDIEMENL